MGVVLWLLFFTGQATCAQTETGTITIDKAVMLENDALGNNEVTSGYAAAGWSVEFRGNATCTCCEDETNTKIITYTWSFGDGTTSSNKDVSHAYHTYGTSGAGNKSPKLEVECTCGATDNKTLSVSVIEGIRVDRIGDIVNPTNNGRLCFNTERRVKATALPEGVNGSNLIDWIVVVGTKTLYTVNNAGHNTSQTITKLATSDWPVSNSAWGWDILYACIDSPLVAGQRNELNLTNSFRYIVNYQITRNFYHATGLENPAPNAAPPNWFYYYKSNEGSGDGYTHTATGKSSAESAGGMDTVKIGNGAYNGASYMEHNYDNDEGLLTVTGLSNEKFKYYAGFRAALAHEKQHATGQYNGGPPDDKDVDRLRNDFETNISKTDPDDDNSAAGTTGWLYEDREYYAGGPVDKAGGESAGQSPNDWACPGTHWPQ